MKPQLLLAALLIAPTFALAAPVAPDTMPPANAGHEMDDDHDHGAPKVNEGSLTDYLWRRSDAAFHAGDYPRAVSLHRAIVQVDPSDVESYSVGAWLLWSMEKGDEANAFIAQGLQANPDDAEMWSAAGDQYDLEKRFADSKDAYAKAVTLAGPNADQMLRRRYAHASEHAGDLGTSAQVWRALVKDFPAEAVNKNNLARVEEQLKAQKTTALTAVGAVGVLALLGVPIAGRQRRV